MFKIDWTLLGLIAMGVGFYVCICIGIIAVGFVFFWSTYHLVGRIKFAAGRFRQRVTLKGLSKLDVYPITMTDNEGVDEVTQFITVDKMLTVEEAKEIKHGYSPVSEDELVAPGKYRAFGRVEMTEDELVAWKKMQERNIEIDKEYPGVSYLAGRPIVADSDKSDFCDMVTIMHHQIA
jgi:hypothetical protein